MIAEISRQAAAEGIDPMQAFGSLLTDGGGVGGVGGVGITSDSRVGVNVRFGTSGETSPKALRGFQRKLETILDSLKRAGPQAMAAALAPAFEKSQFYVPVRNRSAQALW